MHCPSCGPPDALCFRPVRPPVRAYVHGAAVTTASKLYPLISTVWTYVEILRTRSTKVICNWIISCRSKLYCTSLHFFKYYLPRQFPRPSVILKVIRQHCQPFKCHFPTIQFLQFLQLTSFPTDIHAARCIVPLRRLSFLRADLSVSLSLFLCICL